MLLKLLYHNFVNKSRRSLVYHPQLVAVFHRCEALYIIKPQEKYTLGRDEIQGRLAALDDIHDCVVMICQACGLDKKRTNFCLPKVRSFLELVEGFFANSVAFRAVPSHSCFLRFANPWQEKQSTGLFFFCPSNPFNSK